MIHARCRCGTELDYPGEVGETVKVLRDQGWVPTKGGFWACKEACLLLPSPNDEPARETKPQIPGLVCTHDDSTLQWPIMNDVRITWCAQCGALSYGGSAWCIPAVRR